jgi:putative FmdB family regulatory protein
MPSYDYECTSCSHTFEAFQSMSDAPLTTCPTCGGPVRRLISGGSGIIFKGSGFYVTDNKRSGSSPNGNGARKKSEKPGAEPEKKTGGDGDSKKSEPVATGTD